MRKEFLRDLVTHLQGEKVSVFFSSHLLYEIEPVADSIVILDRGRVIKQGATEDLRAQVKRLITSSDAMNIFSKLPGLLDLSHSGRQISAVVEDIAAARVQLQTAGVTATELDLNLDEIFEAYVIGRKEAPHAETALERVA
jgi:ABC-2 type transport system ATP-binding protein